ncbi:hypothetical protein Cfor_00322 [Coptotermes formosanus]|uniref:Uncharacterized protein n=1 Tax=Coptotermes formosanus TaxID=36987 RepID=A0A6L2Q2K9_COPFO|nr:hypothetical protein Cfor_00322 [Coptotermes formosanus]
MVQIPTSYFCCLCSPSLLTDIFTSCADTSRRTDTDSESDDETLPAKRQRTTDSQTNRTGGAHDGGQQFEIKMAAVIGLRGMQMGDNFELATNVKDAGNFDDLVYTTNGRRYCLQLKHTENPSAYKLEPSELAKLLHQCFKKYLNIQDRDKSKFIIFTNKRLGPKLSDHNRQKASDGTVEKVFETCDKGEIFNFIRDNNTDIDVYTRVEKLLKESTEFCNLRSSEQKAKLNMITEFLNKLIMVTGQKGEAQLDDVIIEEIRKYDAVKDVPEMHETELPHFKKLLKSWWRNRKQKMTPEILKNWLQQAKDACCKSLVRSLFESCTKNLARTGIKFSDSEISRLQDELSNKAAVHLKSDALNLCSILLLDCLDTSKCIFLNFESLQSHKNMLLHAWLGGHWEWLIVSCDSAVLQRGISDTCINISEISKPQLSNKRVIILTEYSVQQVRGFLPVYHEFSFEQLSKQSQEMVLEKKIDFQGCEVTMRSVLQRHGNVEQDLGPELVTDLVTGETPVNMGGKLHVNIGYYAPRVLQREVWLHSTVLRNPNDVFAVDRFHRGHEQQDFFTFRQELFFKVRRKCGKYFPGNLRETRSEVCALGRV